jgi:hypothetical protein
MCVYTLKRRYFTFTEATSSLVRHDFIEYACYSSIALRIRSLSSSASGKFHGDQSRGAFRAILQELTECLLRWVVDRSQMTGVPAGENRIKLPKSASAEKLDQASNGNVKMANRTRLLFPSPTTGPDRRHDRGSW